ncbi:MAG: ABC transporter permease [Cyclobacteriaceae bacterium]|nr:ABC transporter permease [Cyclobacteriaceae bacterium]
MTHSYASQLLSSSHCAISSTTSFTHPSNVIGLSIGITCSILILLWVFDEISFDKFIPKQEKLYQVWSNAEFDNTINSWKSVPLPTYVALKTAHANISNTAVSSWMGPHLLTVGETRMNKNGLFVSEEFLEMFEFPMVYGDPSKALDEPTSIVITESTAKALFGDQDPMNKTIRVDNTGDLQVVAILRDVPKTHPWSLISSSFVLPQAIEPVGRGQRGQLG